MLQRELYSCLVVQEAGSGIDAVPMEADIDPELEIPTQEAALLEKSATAAQVGKDR